MDSSPEEKERARRNEVFFRESNEMLMQEREEAGRNADVICECAARGCMERISITPREYVEAHSTPDRFVVAHGHVFPEVEDVVYARPAYVVVEKRPV